MNFLFVVLFLVLGIVCILLEIFVIPGLTIFGIAGFLLLTGSTIYSYLQLGSMYGSLSLLISLGSIFILMRIALKSKSIKNLVNATSENKEDGYSSTDKKYLTLMDKEGISITDLRPSGKVMIENEVYDVVTDGNYLPKETQIKVSKIEGFRIHPV